MARMKYEANGITIEISHGSCVGFCECRDNCPADVFELADSKATAPIV
jgi:NAD-dependent dihydropyrimidine dehydrogenase PreA subunit